MKTFNFQLVCVCLLSTILCISACKGPSGPTGPEGPQGLQGEPGDQSGILALHKNGYVHYTVSGQRNDGTFYTYQENATYYLGETSGTYSEDFDGKTISFMRTSDTIPDVWEGKMNMLQLELSLDDANQLVSYGLNVYIMKKVSANQYFYTNHYSYWDTWSSQNNELILSNYSYSNGIVKGSFSISIPGGQTDNIFDTTIHGDFEVEAVEIVHKK